MTDCLCGLPSSSLLSAAPFFLFFVNIICISGKSPFFNIEGSPALSSVFETEARAGNVRQSVGQSVRGRWSAVEALLQHFDQLVAHVGCLVVDGIAARKVQPDLGDEPVAPSE